MSVRHCLSSSRVIGLCRRYSRSAALRNVASLVVMAEASTPTQQAIVRSVPEETTLTINITLAGQQRSMCRGKDELLEKTLGRIKMNVMPKGKKKQKGPKSGAPAPQQPEQNVDVQLWTDSSTSRAVALDATNEQAWCHGRILKVGASIYSVIVNPPTVDKIVIHGQAVVGIPVCPLPSLSFSEEGFSEWRWERQRGGGDGRWETIQGATGMVYVPRAEDKGWKLRAGCTPARQTPDGPIHGEPGFAEVGPVREGPSVTAGSSRHQLTPSYLQPPGLRVVTYNILADQYASTEYAQKVLFSYCPPRYRSAEYRRPQVLQELLGFHADLICMQEVDEKAFHQYLLPQLQHAGYEGHYTNKAGAAKEGSATFFRRSRFRLVERQDLALKQLFAQLMEQPAADSWHAQLAPIIASSSALRKHLQKVSTVAQITVLAPVDEAAGDSSLCLVNTHLFFHPLASHIRTLHTTAMMVEANRMAEAAARRCPGGERPPIVFCGDLNSGHNKGMPGALELLASGRLPEDFWDWESGRIFRYTKDTDDQAGTDSDPEGDGDANTQALEGFTAAALEIPVRLAPADELSTLFTNFVRGYQGALDYVWYEPSRMAVRREIPLPQPQELAGWIPSERFPSDHLAVVFDLEWRQRNGGEPAPELRSAVSRRVFAANEANLAPGIIALNNHGVVAVPTDTLYGFAGNAEDEDAIHRIYAIKRRPQGVPLAICVASAADVPRYGEAQHLPNGLLQALLPGPVTLLLRRRPNSALARGLNPGVETIGIRVPDCAFIQQLCAGFGGALALTSANLSGQPSSLRVGDFESLWQRCGVIYDGGEIPAAPAGSTIVDLSIAGKYRVVREGIALEATTATLQAHGLQPEAVA